jgi:D-alanyl-D-alanine carboxypeptidase
LTMGAQDIENAEPMDTDLHQRIGSVTKTFTVTALLQLADDGELSLDDPIGDYVADTPNPDATLGDLAAMRSGIPSYTFDPGFQEILFTDPNRVWTPDQLVDLVRGQEPSFAPGTATDYSNTNTVLLGLVIEQVTGQPLHEVIQEQIIEPLELDATTFPTDGTFPEPHAQGYTVQGQDSGLPADANDWNPSWGWAAGAMISSLDDLLVYGEALVAGDELLSPEMQARRIDSFDFTIPPNAPERAYGLGLGLANGWYGHTGELPGYNTVLQHHLDEDVTVVVMVNSDIKSGECPPDAPTVAGGRTEGPCEDPAVHIANQLTAALGVPLAGAG